VTDTAVEPRSRLPRLRELEFHEYALGIVVVLLFVAGAILKPDSFPTWDNIRNMLTQASVVGVLAIGMTFVIATAGIDLSVGSMVAAAGMFGGILVDPEGSSLVFIVGTVAFAFALGSINAVAVAYGRVVPFIATLAMFSIARGLALLLNDKLPVSLLDLNGGSFAEPGVFSLLWFGEARVLAIPVSVYVFLGITIAGWILLNRTRYGRYVVAVGGNREARPDVGQDRTGLAESIQEPGAPPRPSTEGDPLGRRERAGSLSQVFGAKEVAAERTGEKLVRALERTAEQTLECRRYDHTGLGEGGEYVGVK